MNWKRLMLMLAVSAALILPAQPQQSRPAPAGQSTQQVAKKQAKHKKRHKKSRKHRSKGRKPPAQKVQ